MGIPANGIIDRINWIIDFWIDPCGTPPIAMAECALEPTGTLAIALVSFGMDDVIRGVFRPKGLRGGRHGRKGGKKGKRGGGIPEIGEMIGERIPTPEGFQTRDMQAGTKALWILDGAIQRGLWYVMVVDLVTEWTYDWMSGIAVDDRSYCPNRARMRRTGAPRPITGFTGMGLIGINHLHYQNKVSSSQVTAFVQADRYAIFIGCTCRWDGFYETDTCYARIGVIVGDNEVRWSRMAILKKGDSEQIALTLNVEGETNFTYVVWRGLGGNWVAEDIELIVLERKW